MVVRIWTCLGPLKTKTQGLKERGVRKGQKGGRWYWVHHHCGKDVFDETPFFFGPRLNRRL